MPDLGTFPSVGPNQIQTFGVDFGLFLPAGVTLTGIPVLTLTVKYGTDATPQFRVLSGPVITTIGVDNGGTGAPNAGITFRIGTCLSDVTYLFDLYCPRTDGDQVEAWAVFKCVFT